MLFMTWEILLYVFTMGLALSADAFAVSVTDGLIYSDINKKKSLFIATVFGVMQALMPLIGFFLVEIVQNIVFSSIGGSNAVQQANKAGEIISTCVTWVAFALLIFIGAKMLIEAIKEMKKCEKDQPSQCKNFSIKEVLIFGVATSIDALATGVAFHQTEYQDGQFIYTISNTSTIFLHVSIILVITFILSFLGVTFGNKIEKLFKGKCQITSIIGGGILICLAFWIVISHYFL